MRASALLTLAIFSVTLLCAQDAPLEAVTVDGSQIPKEFIVDLAGLKIGAATNPAAIDAAGARLRDSGIFDSVAYRYAPGENRGYVVTLTVVDQSSMSDASIDIPGVDDAEAWKWLAAKYPQFDRFVPKNEAAERFLIALLEEHLAPQLGGQKLVARMETDMTSHPAHMLVSFQPENLPVIASIAFAGQHELTAEQLNGALAKVVAGRGYTDRAFRQMVELNLGRLYEEHGMYRAQFPKIAAASSGPGAVAVSVEIVEGPQFTLGKVDLVGENLPAEAMFKAAKFQTGKLANWTAIQSEIFDSERPLKRTGYMQAASKPERILNDETRILDLKVVYVKGPLFHFGRLSFTGLSAAQEAAARKLWKMAPGDAYDFDYFREFWPGFLKTLGPGRWSISPKSAPGAGDHVVDLDLAITAQ